MRLPQLFRRSQSTVVRSGAQDQAERLLAESLRTLSQLCLKVADLVETQRLERAGCEPQGKFLQRIDSNAPPPGKQR